MRYGRENALESDRLGIRFIAEAGYGLRSMLGLLELLAADDQGEVAGPSSAVHHPSPECCIERIQALSVTSARGAGWAREDRSACPRGLQ